MNTDDGENWQPNAHGHIEGAPSNAELAERMARVEESLDHVDHKLDHIADCLDDSLTETQETVKEIKAEHNRLWLVYQGAKWAVVVGSGSSVLALFISLVMGMT